MRSTTHWLYACIMHSIDKYMHALDGRGWGNTMAKIRNVSSLAEFANHFLSKGFQFFLKFFK